MKDQAWLRRLSQELPGWFVYTSSVGKKWRTVPAPAGTAMAEALDMPKHVYADTPAELRAAAQMRYGWYDHCESCGTLARECGHRQPEREGARRKI
jgi:hypothetical protein